MKNLQNFASHCSVLCKRKTYLSSNWTDIVHRKGCLFETLAGMDRIPFILAKFTWPNLVCHNKCTLFLWEKQEFTECNSLLQYKKQDFIVHSLFLLHGIGFTTWKCKREELVRLWFIWEILAYEWHWEVYFWDMSDLVFKHLELRK